VYGEPITVDIARKTRAASRPIELLIHLDPVRAQPLDRAVKIVGFEGDRECRTGDDAQGFATGCQRKGRAADIELGPTLVEVGGLA
jgi:hypothetical protein